MQYTCEVVIKRPIEEVAALLDDRDNLTQWQDTFRSWEPLCGEPGNPGAKTRLVYGTGDRRTVLVETILARNGSHEFVATYETEGLLQTVRSRLEALDTQRTRWRCSHELRFRGLTRLVGWWIGRGFSQQTLQAMNAFKAFAELKHTADQRQ